MKLWGGRFARAGRDPHTDPQLDPHFDPLFERFSESFSVDQRLVLYDLRVNQAWVKALGRADVLRPAEVRRLTRGLEAIRTSVEAPSAGRPEASRRQTVRRNVSTHWQGGASSEDVHTRVAERLEKEL